MRVSQAQMMAMEVLWRWPLLTVGEFIHKMWPNKVKENEKISGGFVLSACCLLKRMQVAGLVVPTLDDRGTRWILTSVGAQTFENEEQCRLNTILKEIDNG